MSPRIYLCLLIFYALIGLLLPFVVGKSTCPEKCTCTAHLKTVNCNGKRLGKIPENIPVEVTLLYLNKNGISKIQENDLRNLTNLTQLHLISNKIDEIHENAFRDLISLKELNLRENHLIDTSLPKNLFDNTRNLTKLYLTSNHLTAIPELGNSYNLVDLSLDTNLISSVAFPQSFENFTNLRSLNLANNLKLKSISKEDFQYILSSPITSINLGRCDLSDIAPDVFAFPHLQSLSLAYNANLNQNTLKNIFQSLAEVKKSEFASLALSGIQISEIDKDLFQSLARVPIKTLTMEQIFISTFHAGTFDYFPKLEILHLGNSKLLTTIENGTFSDKLSKLKTISLINANLVEFPEINTPNLEELKLSRSGTFDNLPPKMLSRANKLKKLDISNCRIHKTNVDSLTGLTQLTYLDMSSNTFGALPDNFFDPVPSLKTLSIRGNHITNLGNYYKMFLKLENLEELDASENGCTDLSLKIFQPLKKLNNLNLDSNELNTVIASDTQGELFRGLTTLSKLSVASNKLHSLPDKLFQDQINLKSLNLHDNFIESWKKNFISEHVAENNTVLVDLSNNKISIVTQMQMTTSPDNVHLNLSNNPFSCSCDLIWFRKWISAHNESEQRILDLHTKLLCSSPEKLAGKHIEEFHPEDIENYCFPPPWIWIVIAVGSSVAIAALIFGILIYRYRWPMRLKWYRFKKERRQRNREGYTAIGEDVPQFDITLIHGPSERIQTWVTDTLLPEIDREIQDELYGENRDNADGKPGTDENLQTTDDNINRDETGPSQHTEGRPTNQRWSVFLYDRDIPLGENDIGVITDAIYNSRKILLILSKDYLQDSRRLFETKQAIDACISRGDGELNSFIIIQMERGIDMDLPRSLHCIASNPGKIIQWFALNSNRSNRSTFFDVLRERIMEPVQLNPPID